MVTPGVVVPAGDEASGLATMLADLLRDNMKDFPGRGRAAGLARGSVVMRASDRDASVTLSFRGGEVVVTDGVTSGAPVVQGAWLDLAKLCSGQISPVRAVVRRQLKITPAAHGLTALAGASYALSVPPSFYGDEEAVAKRKQQVQITMGVTLGAVAAIAWSRHRRHLRRSLSGG